MTKAAKTVPTDAPGLSATAKALDQHLHAAVARATGGLSPIALTSAWVDWSLNLAVSPGRQAELADLALQGAVQLATGKAPLPAHDHRFDHPGWAEPPFRALAAGYALAEGWWAEATRDLPALEETHARMAAFYARQILDVLSPSNFVATNPEVLAQTRAEAGANLARGLAQWAEDARHALNGAVDPSQAAWPVGQSVAATPGEVVFRNRLIEVIQYAPTTARVQDVPLLIVPAWIMKYYVLDLTAAHSLIGWLVGQGFTVFCISWKNPGSEDRDLSFDDYRTLGVMEAVKVATEISGAPRVHALGYCLGGTLLAVTAAAMARDGDDRLASLTLLAAQVDFTEAGDLSLFTTQAQIALLEDLMAEEGYLDDSRMAGTFSLLKSEDLIWSRMVHEYLLGEREALDDLMAWSRDATRLPARMHSEYLRHMFLHNDLAEGRMPAGGAPVVLADIAVPVFAIATEQDHVAPWPSVFKLTQLLAGDVRFALVSGGHNSGIVAPPGMARAHYRLLDHHAGATHPAADLWAAEAPVVPGSWWQPWADWLRDTGGNRTVAPPPMASARFPALEPAPGHYVR
jgi:polyhydroxyalkanoate synthase